MPAERGREINQHATVMTGPSAKGFGKHHAKADFFGGLTGNLFRMRLNL
jgi:hypothetical protein